jgi:hypothetical protein
VIGKAPCVRVSVYDCDEHSLVFWFPLFFLCAFGQHTGIVEWILGQSLLTQCILVHVTTDEIQAIAIHSMFISLHSIVCSFGSVIDTCKRVWCKVEVLMLAAPS